MQPLRRSLRVLVADDNRDTVLSLVLLLQDEGHEVRGVYNGADVVRAARMQRFDVVILDIEMPDMSGYAIARELRTFSHAMPAPLLVAITGKWTRPSEKLLSHVVGFDHHLEKPCDPGALISLLTAQKSTFGRGKSAYSDVPGP